MDKAVDSLLNSGDIAISALVFLILVLIWLLATEKRDHKETKESERSAFESAHTLSEKVIKALYDLRETINQSFRGR